MIFRKTLYVVAAVAAACLLLSMNADAHHSAAAYDVEKNVAVNGVIKSFRWKNPHTLISLAVTGEDGNVVIWNFEGNGASNLVRNGWRRSMLKVGDKVTIHANPMKSGEPGGRLRGATLEDGTLMGEQ